MVWSLVVGSEVFSGCSEESRVEVGCCSESRCGCCGFSFSSSCAAGSIGLQGGCPTVLAPVSSSCGSKDVVSSVVSQWLVLLSRFRLVEHLSCLHVAWQALVKVWVINQWVCLFLNRRLPFRTGPNRIRCHPRKVYPHKRPWRRWPNVCLIPPVDSLLLGCC